jgi:hypothetical protein
MAFCRSTTRSFIIDPHGIACLLLESCQKPLGGHSAMTDQLRYTAPLVQIEEFEGQP